ncbi:MAG: two-component system sensor kinase FixL [Lentimonas sp.]|jgi:two-component system sensor kinase FixL
MHVPDSPDTFFHRIYKRVSVACVVLCSEGCCCQSNSAFSQLVGMSESELRGVPFVSHVHPDEVNSFVELYGAILSERITSCEMENRLLRKDGRITWVKCLLSMVYEDNGNNRYIVIEVSDISRKKRIREKLRSSERSLEQFFDNAPIGILWSDAVGVITRVNRSMLTLVGFEGNQIFGSSISDWIVKPDLSRVLAQLKEKGEVKNYRAKLHTATGEDVHVIVDAVSICEGQQVTRTDWFFRDISARIHLEQRVIETTEAERQQLGHELHDDLGQILHGAYFISSSLRQTLKEKGIEEYTEIDRVATCLSEAMRSVRNIARGLQPVAALPEGLVDALERHAEHVQQIYGVKCNFFCPVNLQVADPKVATHLFRIVQESVSNAVKHSKCEHIHIMLKCFNKALILEVSDDGVCNIPEDSASQGMGLRVMQFRAHAIRGSLLIERNHRGGTLVRCLINPFINNN